MQSFTTLAIGAIFLGSLAPTSEPDAEFADDFVRPFPVVAVPTGATDGHRAAAQEIADAIGVSAVSELATNPICCVCVEITGWTPNPGRPGYVIVNQGGGSIIRASNEEQLRAAVARFKASIRKQGGVALVPAGLLTSYRVVTTPTADR